MRVVDQIKVDQTTGETKYWVQDLRLSDSRVYLDLDAVQKYKKTESMIGNAVASVLAVAGMVSLLLAFGKKS